MAEGDFGLDAEDEAFDEGDDVSAEVFVVVADEVHQEIEVDFYLYSLGNLIQHLEHLRQKRNNPRSYILITYYRIQSVCTLQCHRFLIPDKLQ